MARGFLNLFPCAPNRERVRTKTNIYTKGKIYFMKYQRYLKEIKTIVEQYKKRIDELVVLKKEQDAELEKMKNSGIYSDSYIEEYTKTHNNADKFAVLMEQDRKTSIEKAYYYKGLVKKDIDKFFNGDVTTSIANKVQAIKNSGLQLSNRELDLLKAECKSYYDLRLLQQIASTRTEKQTVTETNKDGEFINVVKDVTTPYNIVIPDIENAYRNYEDFSAHLDAFFTTYCGANHELKESLPPDRYGMPREIYESIYANSFIEKNKIDTFESGLNETMQCLPENNIKTALTDTDKAIIDTIINPQYPNLAKTEVERLSELSPELAELFSLDERYRDFVIETEQ